MASIGLVAKQFLFHIDIFDLLDIRLFCLLVLTDPKFETIDTNDEVQNTN